MGDDRHPTAAGAGVASWPPLPAWAVASLAGLLAGLALPPIGFPPLLWPALALLWSLAPSPAGQAAAPADRSPAGHAAPAGRRWGGLLWGLAAVLVSHRWLLWLHPLDWVGVPLPLSLPVCLLLWGGCGLLGGLLVQLWLQLVGRLDPRRPSTAVAAACVWGLAEVQLARGPLFWIGLGSSALPADRPLAGLAALGGAALVAAVQLLLGWCLWRLVEEAGARRRWLLLSLALLVCTHALGAIALADSGAGGTGGTSAAAAESSAAAPAARLPQTAHGSAAGDAAATARHLPLASPQGEGSIERLLVLQPAIPTRQKFEAAQQLRLLSQLAAAQRRAADLADREAIAGLLLPEGALALDQPLPAAAAVEVLSGGFRRQDLELRSSLLRFPPGSREARGWIDKHRVVPLGEWVPLASLWRWSGLSAVGGVEPGPPSRLLPRPAGAIGVAICYELADGTALARASRDGARWLLASANLDPYPPLLQEQFLALARLRAIETGRWLVAAANTGPSLAVDATGRLRQRLPAGRPALGLFSLRQRTSLTPYDRWGERPVLALLLLAAGQRLGWLRIRRPPGRPR